MYRKILQYTDTLQRVMNAATCVVSETRKFDYGLLRSCMKTYTGSMWQIE